MGFRHPISPTWVPVTQDDLRQLDLVDQANAIVDAEQVFNIIQTQLVEGTNITLTIDDTLNTITIDSTGGGSGVADGDYGDIVVTGTGANFAFDSGVVTAFARTLLDDADAATMRGTLGLGSAALSSSGDFQPIDADLTAIAALSTTVYGRGLLTFANQAALQAAAHTPGSLLISITDLPLSDPAVPLFRWRFTSAVVFTGGTADADIGATSTSALRIRKNGAANGTISFTGTTGTVSFTSGSYASGDLFELYPPASVDATLDQVSITLETT